MDFILFLTGDKNKGVLPDIQAIVEQSERRVHKEIGPPVGRVREARQFLVQIIRREHLRESEQIVPGISLTKRLKRRTSTLSFVAQNDERGYPNADGTVSISSFRCYLTGVISAAVQLAVLDAEQTGRLLHLFHDICMLEEQPPRPLHQLASDILWLVWLRCAHRTPTSIEYESYCCFALEAIRLCDTAAVDHAALLVLDPATAACKDVAFRLHESRASVVVAILGRRRLTPRVAVHAVRMLLQDAVSSSSGGASRFVGSDVESADNEFRRELCHMTVNALAPAQLIIFQKGLPALMQLTMRQKRNEDVVLPVLLALDATLLNSTGPTRYQPNPAQPTVLMSQINTDVSYYT